MEIPSAIVVEMNKMWNTMPLVETKFEKCYL